jgi:phenylacetate-CoA ligase
MTRLPERLMWSASSYLKVRAERKLPYLSPEKLHAHQERRVGAMVAHAYATVPHYREAMMERSLHPADLATAASLSELPLVTGADLADSPGRFYSDEYRESNTLTLHSSGTGGRAKAVRYDKAALFEALAHGHRQRAVMRHFTGRSAGYREMGIRRRDSISVQMRQFYESHSWVPRPMDVERGVLDLDLSFDEMVKRINAFKPDVVTGYGSHLGALFRWARERRQNLHRPKLIWYGADAMPVADRALIEQQVGIPVMSTYQADEALRIGFQCEQLAGFHLSVDDLAVRVLKPDGHPAGPGEQGEIVISNLSNRATVLLNYKLGDVVTMPSAPCSCGRTLPTIEAVAGRADDMIQLENGESRHSLLFMAPMHGVPGVVQVQLVQENTRQLSINAVCAAGSEWAMVKNSLERIARDLTGPEMAVHASRLEAIPREPGGKTRAVISHARSPRD